MNKIDGIINILIVFVEYVGLKILYIVFLCKKKKVCLLIYVKNEENLCLFLLLCCVYFLFCIEKRWI